MRTPPAASSAADIAGELSAWMAAGGILTMMLFPLALPLILLLVVSALPLVLIPLAAGLAAAVVAVPVLLLRALWRRASRALRPASTAGQEGTPARQET